MDGSVDGWMNWKDTVMDSEDKEEGGNQLMDEWVCGWMGGWLDGRMSKWL